jgi:hypothetical protein
MSTTITFQTLQDQSQASELVQLLLENNIQAELEILPLTSDNSFVQSYAVQIGETQLEKAHQLLAAISEADMAAIPSDYYLYAFTRQELLDVVAQSYEWSELDVVLAQKLLREQGETLTEAQMKDMQSARIQELSKADKPAGSMISIGYTTAALGGLLGLIIGWNLMRTKKLLPNGEKVFAYSAESRAHGKRICILGACVLFISVTIRIVWGITQATN